MPVLKVYGIPSSISQGRLEILIGQLQSVTGSALNLPQSEVTVFFPADLCQQGLGEELVCFIDGLFEKPDRTSEVRRRLAQAIWEALANFVVFNFLSKCGKVEVIPTRFDQNKDGFATGDPHNPSHPAQ